MRRSYPDLAPLATPQDTGVRDSVLLTALCAQCGGLITITLLMTSPVRISHRGCQHPSTAIAAITAPTFQALPREAD